MLAGLRVGNLVVAGAAILGAHHAIVWRSREVLRGYDAALAVRVHHEARAWRVREVADKSPAVFIRRGEQAQPVAFAHTYVPHTYAKVG